MKKNIISALFSGLVILLAGCSSDVLGDPESPDASGGSILSLDIDIEEPTRSGIDSTTFDEGDEVFVIVKDRTNPDILTVTTKAIYTDGRWRLADKIDFAASYAGVVWSIADIQVYYPYKEAYEGYDKESGKINVNFSQTDFLYGASYGWSKDYPDAKVSCKHAMTRLTLALINTTDSDATVGKVGITNQGVQSFLGSKGSIDVNGINVTDYSTGRTVYNGNIEIAPGETGYCDILLPPTLAAYDKMLEQIDNGSASKTVLKFEVQLYDYTLKFDIDAKAWSEEHRYIYPVKLTGRVKPDPDSFEYVDLGLSVLWASCNVGASNPYEVGKFFFWGDTKGYVDGETFSQTDFSFIYPKEDEVLLDEGIIEIAPNADASQYKYRLSSKYDAATYNMGSPWRMPMADELQELVDNTNFELVNVEDKWMFKFTSKVSGFEDKYIMIPYPQGCFNTSGGGIYKFTLYNNPNQPSGNWWSSSLPFDYNNRGMVIEILWYYLQDKPSTWIRSLGRNTGYNVRGVRTKE